MKFNYTCVLQTPKLRMFEYFISEHSNVNIQTSPSPTIVITKQNAAVFFVAYSVNNTTLYFVRVDQSDAIYCAFHAIYNFTV